MPTFRRPEDLRRHLEQAVAQQLRLSVVQAQAELGSVEVSPVDTGRLRSSWFASKGAPSDAVAPEGANAPNTDAQALRVQFGDELHVTNSLPYAESACVEGRVVSKPTTWFKSFRETRLPEIGDAAGKLVKREFDL